MILSREWFLESENGKAQNAIADRGGDPWAFSRKGKLGGSEVFIGGHGGRHSSNISKIARKLVKRRPCWKRNGHGLFYDLFISDSMLLLLVVGQIVKTPLPLQRKVPRHISGWKQLTSFGIAMQNNGESFRRKFVCK